MSHSLTGFSVSMDSSMPGSSVDCITAISLMRKSWFYTEFQGSPFMWKLSKFFTPFIKPWATSHIYILSYKEVTTSALHGEFPSYSEEPEARERKLSAWSQLENDQQGFFPLLYLEFTPNSYWRICCCLVPKLCPTLCDPIDCSQRGSSVHGIFQARILVHVAISHSR